VKAIIAKDLVKKYKSAKFNAVDGVDLEVEDGEIFGFLGPNGAGKSTTIKMLVTTLFPTSGDAEIFGVNTKKNPRKIREMIGVVYQKPSLDEKLTAEENLRSQAILYEKTGFSLSYRSASKEYKERIKDLLNLVGLWEKRHDVVGTFSGGMKRRLDIAKALLHTPKILFLDEPTTGLDPKSRRDIWEYLEDLQEKNKFTIFLTTQYLEEAEVCDRISIIDSGKILITDTPNNLKKSAGHELLYVNPVDESSLENELNKKQIDFQRDKKGNYILEIGTEKAQNFIKQIESDLDEINIKKPTLDDVFIKLTGKTIEV